MSFTVLIDPGHGGDNHGVTVGGWREKDFTLQAANCLVEALAYAPLDVCVSRNFDCDLSLTERGRLATHYDASVVVSIHANSHEQKDVAGSDVFCWPGSGAGRRLAESIGIRWPKERSRIHAVDPGGWKSRAYNVLSKYPPDCVAVLVECGFATNPKDLAYMQTEAAKWRFAYAMASGIMRLAEVFDGTIKPREKR